MIDPQDGGRQAIPVEDVDLEQVSMGSRLKTLRVERCITLIALATAAGIDEAKLDAYERGKLRLSAEDVYRLANALDTSIPALFGRTCPE